jgi:hypothetical protein
VIASTAFVAIANQATLANSTRRNQETFEHMRVTPTLEEKGTERLH